MPGDNIPESMGEDFSESVGDYISEGGGDIISEWMGGFPRNQQSPTLSSIVALISSGCRAAVEEVMSLLSFSRLSVVMARPSVV